MCRPFPLVVNRSSPHSTSSQTHQTDRSWHSRGQGQCFVDPSPTRVSSFSVGCSPGRNHTGDEARRCLRGTSFDSHSAQVSDPPCDVDDRRGLVFPGQDRLSISLQTTFPAIPPDATPVVRGPRRLRTPAYPDASLQPCALDLPLHAFHLCDFCVVVPDAQHSRLLRRVPHPLTVGLAVCSPRYRTPATHRLESAVFSLPIAFCAQGTRQPA